MLNVVVGVDVDVLFMVVVMDLGDVGGDLDVLLSEFGWRRWLVSSGVTGWKFMDDDVVF